MSLSTTRAVATLTEATEQAPSVLRWTALCAVAEALGMTAAAGASHAGQVVVDRPGPWGGAGWALAIIIAGGLVEGIALGSAQAWSLGGWLSSLQRGRYLLMTVVVAGLGWAGASAPAVLMGEGGGAAPPLPLVLVGAAGLGLVMGPVLGSAQAVALRGATTHPWRWIGANAVAWPPAMCLIFLGASAPGEDWPVARLLLLGAATGALAGAVLGLITGWHLASLNGAAPHNRLVLGLLATPWRGRLDRRLVGLGVRGRRTGRSYRFPAQYAVDSGGLVLVPGHAEHKTWWRNLREPGTPVEVLWGGDWVPGAAELLSPGDPGYAVARSTYHRRWPHLSLPPEQVVVRIRYAGPSAGNA
ncbi:hypothetical protein ACT8ZV_12690 [Nocardioides sp. MAHUQ-72]|uniref:hypothetical protein n=1 Tax=unclassified Nocardioides TaxID=2615069 RepID=UPI003616971D